MNSEQKLISIPLASEVANQIGGWHFTHACQKSKDVGQNLRE